MNCELEKISLLKSVEDDDDGLDLATIKVSGAQTNFEDVEDSESDENEPVTPYRKMVFLSVIVTFPGLLCGMVHSYPAVALPQMNLSIAEASWFGSCPSIAAPIGGISLSLIIDHFGRKSAIMAAIAPQIIGWFLIFLDYNHRLSILGRTFTGLTTGSAFYPIQVYISECIALNDPQLRTTFSTSGSLLASSGVFLIFLLGSFVKFQFVAAFALIIAITSMSLISFAIPESPTWLYLQGQLKDAKKSEKRLGIYQPILHEDTTLVQTKTNKLKRRDLNYWIRFVKGLSKFKRKDIYKPVSFLAVLGFFRSATGGQAVLTYAVHIINMDTLNEAPNTKTYDQFSNAYKFSIVLGIIIVSARFFSLCITHRLGIKKLGLGAIFVLCIGHFLIGFVWSRTVIDSKLFYINAIGVFIVEFGFYAGVILFPNHILSDALPIDARGFGALIIVTSQISASVFIKLHPYLNLYYGSYIYIGYFCMGIICGIYMAYFLPETVGKSSKEVQKVFS